jgi:cytochrome oxidase Cu insertion factor (SCO1/SenC/PrrC family)/thiol-disulfide isomerase/thioredoxin
MRRAWAIVLGLLATLAVALAGAAPPALADGDPGSDVLVYQSLFVAGDSGVSVSQQARLAQLLAQAQRDRFPIRVAIISSPEDLGSVTALWRKPQAYASFLGVELSLAYTGRLLVVMPNGFGFNWPGHASAPADRTLSRIAIRPGGGGLAGATQTGVGSLAAAAGVKLAVPTEVAGAQPSSSSSTVANVEVPASESTASGAPRAAPSSNADTVVAIVVAALAALIAAVLVARRLFRGRAGARRLRAALRRPRSVVPIAATATVASGAAIVVLVAIGAGGAAPSAALATNPQLDPGTPLSGRAADFTLTDQFGQPVSLSSFRGKVVMLAFTDSECTTICPLTTMAMLDAKAMLPTAGDRVQLLGIDANPKSTSLEDVQSYSELHGMVHAWDFVTGSLAQLRRVWKAYGIEAAVEGGEIAHTPALFVIDPRGRLAKLYLTQQSYAAVGQFGQLLAEEASSLLPGRPTVDSHYTYAQISGIPPSTQTGLPRSAGGTVRLGPGRARLYVFFATWDQEITSLGGQLDALNGYASSATSDGLPSLTAVDEGSVEPSRAALSTFLAGLRHPLSYPVAIDSSGRVADGYEVEGQPWFVLTSATGQIAWYWQVSTSGWLSRSALIAQVRAALARVPAGPRAAAAVRAELAGSPPPLARIHSQADQLLGGEPALAARIRSLRGYPIVLNAWGSWCGPCQAEFGLFAAASARYGQRVAFLGADVNDVASDARAFLAQHPVSYPSYQMSSDQITPILPPGLAGTPTTIFIGPTGKLVDVHVGQYQSQGSLDADIQADAPPG